MDTVTTPEALPAGDYAIVEVMGHRTLIGRVEEIERFGTKLLQVEPLFAGKLLGPVLIGGASIYQFTMCSAEIAASRCPRSAWQLPASVRAVLPPDALPAPEAAEDDAELQPELPSFLHEAAGGAE